MDNSVIAGDENINVNQPTPLDDEEDIGDVIKPWIYKSIWYIIENNIIHDKCSKYGVYEEKIGKKLRLYDH